MLPASRNTTYAPLAQLQSADLNAIQDRIVDLYRGLLHLIPIDVAGFTASTIDQGKIAGMGYRHQLPLAGQPLLVAAHATGNDIIRSVDGVTWLAVANIATYSGVQHHRAVFYSELLGEWVILTKTGSADAILTAADPTAVWTVHVDPQIGGDDRGGMAENGTILIAPGTVEIFGTDSGGGWSFHNSPGTGETMRAAAWSPALGLFAVVGDNGSVATAPDGTSWTDQSAGVALSLAAVDFKDVMWDPIRAWFLAVGTGGKIALSVDGLIWADVGVDADLTDDLISIATDGAGAVVITAEDYVLNSYDGGETWYPQVRPDHISTSPAAMYANGRVIVFGQSNVTGHAAVSLGVTGSPIAVIAT